MNQLLSDIKSYMVFKKVSMQKLGDMIHKDMATVAKQLDVNRGNPNLANIDMIVRALGGRIVLETPESINALETADLTEHRYRIKELGLEVDRLREEIARLRDVIADKDERIARRDKIMAEQNEAISRLRHAVEQKDAMISKAMDALLEKR